MTVTESQPTLKDGRVVAIAGPVIDVEFPPDAVPQINTMLRLRHHHRRQAATRCGPRSPSRSATAACGPSA